MLLVFCDKRPGWSGMLCRGVLHFIVIVGLIRLDRDLQKRRIWPEFGLFAVVDRVMEGVS